MSIRQGCRLTVVAFLILFSSSIYSATSTVNANNTHQVIDGFGGSNAWSDCGSCIPGSAKNAWFTAARLDELFTTAGNGIGLSIMRMRIPPDAGQFGSAVGPVQGAAARGALVMATAWTPPTNWKTVNQAGNNPPSELQAQYYDEYATYLRNFVTTMNAAPYNLSIYALSPANEPDYQVTYDGCDWTGNQLRDFVKFNLGPTFEAAGLTTKIMVGESFRNQLAITDPTLNDAVARDYTDIIAEHTYGGGPTLYPLCQTHGKTYWITERSSFETYDGTMTHGLVVAGWLHNSLAVAEFSAFVYWWLASDASNEGLTSETQGHPKRFYVMGNYSKFVRPGFVRVDATASPAAGITTSAYKNPAGTGYVIVATNTNGSAQSLTVNLTGVTASSFIPYITSSSLNLAAQAAVNVTANSFTYTLPAQSVVSFVATGPAPTVTQTVNPAWSRTFTPTSTATPSSVLLDDMEDGNNNNNWGGGWYSYSGTGTTITPKPFTMTAGGMTGSAAYRAQIVATVADYAGVGTNLNAAQTGVDLTSYVAVEFWVKGNGGNYWFHFTQADITSGDYYGVAFTAPATWTKVTVNIDQASLGKRGFGTETGAFTKNAVVALQWTSNGNGALDIQVDNVAFLTNAAVTPVNTPTRTVTNTPLVPTSTYTRTPTFSRTMTLTYTRTNTPVNTLTASPVNSATRTMTSTQVITSTSTVVPTFTRTATNTAVSTVTSTGTITLTPTTSIYSPTITQTQTLFISATYTATMSHTEISTPTLTTTRTPAETITNTPAVSNTGTPVSTITSSVAASATRTFVNTPVNSATSSPTSTLTRTNTAVNTATLTSTRTAVNTSTNTFTRTRTATYTQTAVNTATRTFTLTATLTNTLVSTPTITQTNTPVPTATIAWGDKFEIPETLIYPNPCNPETTDMKIKINITQAASEMKVKIFTRAYRKMMETPCGAVNTKEVVVTVPSARIRHLSAGIYYMVVTGKSTGGENAVSKPVEFIILR